MSTTTEDGRKRKSKVDAAREGIPFNDLRAKPVELAPETPFTRESAIHLRAAASEIDGPSIRAQSMIKTVERALAEPMGGGKSFSEDERMDLAELLSAAQDEMIEKVVFPVFEWGRGERPHGGVQENGDAPPAGDVSAERLFDVLNVARGCLELAADAELENSYGVSPRTMFRQVCEFLRPAYDDTLEALGRDLEEELGTANGTLEALAAEIEGDDSEGGESRE